MTALSSAPTKPFQVSVVIPAYNQAHFLADAMRSVLAQTYTDFELILVDDGSTDDTPAVARQFNGLLPNRLHYIRQTNQGLAGARNTGIRSAAGEFVALLDSDDQWLPDYLKKMLQMTEEQPQATVYYCPVVYMDADGRELPQQTTGIELSPDQIYPAMLRANFLVPSTILARRQVVLEAGLFDPIFRRLQDWELWLRLLRAGHTFAGTRERLVRYRLHGSSLSSDAVGGQRAALAMVEKLFGSDDGQYQGWLEEKRRAYGGAYRYQVLSYVQRQDDWQSAAQYLRKALQVDPSIAGDINLFYELGLGAQPIGYRGTGQNLAFQDNILDLKSILQDVFRPPLSEPLAGLQRRTWGTAYYALGLLAYNLGQLSTSRRYLISALRLRPDLTPDKRAAGILLKSLMGSSNLDRLRRLRRALQSSVPENS